MLVGVDGYFQVFKLWLCLEKGSTGFEDLKGLPQQCIIMEQAKAESRKGNKSAKENTNTLKIIQVRFQIVKMDAEAKI